MGTEIKIPDLYPVLLRIFPPIRENAIKETDWIRKNKRINTIEYPIL